MSSRMQPPQVRHSNVAVVRFTKNGTRLEIACYKNKVVSYRAGLETRMDEVLQIDRVFTNVGRGSYASANDIRKALGEGFTEASAVRYVLDHGDLQVAQQERTCEHDEIVKDVATIISQKCVHSVTNRPFPTNVIEQALRTLGAIIKVDQPVKKQALALIHQLVESNIIPIQRAMMKLRVTLSNGTTKATVTEWCLANGAEVLIDGSSETDASSPSLTSSDVVRSTATSADVSDGGSSSVLFLLQPHLFRDAEVFVKQLGCTLNVIETSVAETGGGAAADLEAVLLQDHRGGLGGSGESPLAAGGVPSPATVSSMKTSAIASSSKPSKSERNGSHRHHEAKVSEGGSSSRDGKHFSQAPATVSGDDDDDDGKKKKKKKAKKAPVPASNKKQQQPQPSTREDGSDDDDIVSERKKKKHQQQQPQQMGRVCCDDDDDGFDYGEGDDDGEDAAAV